MRHIFTCLFACLLVANSFAQLSHGGSPYLFNYGAADDIAAVQMPPVALDRYRAEDEQMDQYKSMPRRFGVNIETDIDVNNSGTWTTLPNGDRLWQVVITSPGALSLNFVFDQYIMPEGGKIFVYDLHGKQIRGSYTAENTSEIGSLGVGLIKGDALIIEYQEPSNVAGQGFLHINNVTHGYRSILGISSEAKAGPFGNSGPCNINVSCPEGDPYDVQRSSVAVIVVNNNGSCSGSMINNTSADGTPYFLTANHCLPFNIDNTNNWIMYFNHESPGCEGSTGPTNQSISGATFVARNQESDFGLVELSSAPPLDFNVCYAGWDATDDEDAVTSAIGIHHPSGDVKKICFENDAPYHNDLGSFLVNTTWYVDQWELGVTESGSSGSPLYNQNGLIIGQLAGGSAACAGPVNNGGFDFYGRMGVSWDFGPTPTSRLRDWLDPNNTGALVTPPLCPSDAQANNISITNPTGVVGVKCDTDAIPVGITVINTGDDLVSSFELSYSLNGGSVESFSWNGSLEPFNSIVVEIGVVNPLAGDNTVSIEVESVNGGEDEDPVGNSITSDFTAIETAVDVTVAIAFDDWPGETTWQIATETGEILHAGGPYTSGDENFEESFCVAELTCYVFTIFDEEDDGICCGFGEGSYLVTDQFGNTLASGGEFTSEESTEFCTQALSTEESAVLQSVSIFPNPAKDRVVVDPGNVSAIQAITVFDAVGRLVWQSGERYASGGQIEIGTSTLGRGMYLIQIATDEGVAVRKLLINR